MQNAWHRDVPPMLVIQIPDRDLIEAVDVDHEVEPLPSGQAVCEYEKLLRLLVAFVSKAERNQLLGLEVGILLEIRHEPVGTYFAKPGCNRTAEDADDELLAVRRCEWIIVRRRKAEIVRCRP